GGYFGHFEDATREGVGMFRSPWEGLFGRWTGDLLQGPGVVLSMRGVYLGDMKDGKPHGTGRFKHSSTEEYEGEFKNGLRDGTGTHTQPSEVYRGQWKEGLRHGPGTLTVNGRTLFEGVWDRGNAPLSGGSSPDPAAKKKDQRERNLCEAECHFAAAGCGSSSQVHSVARGRCSNALQDCLASCRE
ncbi:MAG: hypothetical protein HY554_09585, partial [Elusimicrobia bacterium]|nr:hypothetical protein [Elusimicrobiota bacterium]